MKTLSEHEEEQRLLRIAKIEAADEKDKTKLAAVKAQDIPLAPSPHPPNSVWTMEGGRANMREIVRCHNHGGWVGLACDFCKTELIYTNNITLATIPPCKVVGCIGCGWTGYKDLR